MTQDAHTDEFHHRPVMVDEVVGVLGAVPAGLLVDATVGGGGHSAALLDAHPGLRVLGLDRDLDAVAEARHRLADHISAGRAVVVHARFDAIATEVARAAGGPWGPLPVTAVLFDLGVSSPQLDRADRGFSYRQPGPLDMRMDRSQGMTAADVVNTYPEHQLAGLFRENGESRYAVRIARAIIAGRPFEDTFALAETVRDAIPAPARRRGGHPAKRVFQAIRIEVNGELDLLAGALTTSLDLLAVGGRIAVLSYHSGEDRIVKATLVEAATGGCTCPPGLPCACGANPQFRLVFRGSRTPGAAERTDNPRAESARLRAAERIVTADPAASDRSGVSP
jgi:16S rRNA (cytosine1402-N4)-methyltransferase